MAQARRVRAITAGLDLAPGLPPRRVQELALEALLQLCQWLDLPVILHAGAESGARLVELLRASRDLFPAGVLFTMASTRDGLRGYRLQDG
jgi:Tat protein secretion system quality control protein TatD with DNase activity